MLRFEIYWPREIGRQKYVKMIFKKCIFVYFPVSLFITILVSKCHNVLYNKVTYTAIPYPLSFGAKLDDALVPFVDKLFPGDWTHLAKFLWVTGQFTKYAMRLNSTFEQELANLMKQAGFGKSIKIVG